MQRGGTQAQGWRGNIMHQNRNQGPDGGAQQEDTTTLPRTSTGKGGIRIDRLTDIFFFFMRITHIPSDAF